MSVPSPHFRLLCEGHHDQGQWHFVLQAEDGAVTVEAADHEPGTYGERLELLAVVRGLEAIDEPSRVTLVTRSQYVLRGLRFGLEEWRTNGWTWERFGQMVPIKNRDLWQRLDRALNYHRCDVPRASAAGRKWRIDAAHSSAPVTSQHAAGDGKGNLSKALGGVGRRLSGAWQRVSGEPASTGRCSSAA